MENLKESEKSKLDNMKDYKNFIKTADFIINKEKYSYILPYFFTMIIFSIIYIKGNSIKNFFKNINKETDDFLKTKQ
jgi:hypothetical protein